MPKWIVVIIGLLLVGGSTYGYAKYWDSYELEVTTMDTIKPVRMIQAGELITASMIKKVSIPSLQHMSNGIIEPEQIIGKRAMTPIGENEEFLIWKIVEDTLYPKKNEEYLGFKVDFVSAVNNMVRRGDKVNVWVEYTQPKIFDSNGIEINDDEKARRIALDPNFTTQGFKKIYNKLLIEDMTVAYVKDQDGKEITDVGFLNDSTFSLLGTAAQRDNQNAERYRQNASGQPSYITFIMSREQYASFAEGAKEGTIRFGLPSSSVVIGTIVPNPAKNTAGEAAIQSGMSVDLNESGDVPEPKTISNSGTNTNTSTDDSSARQATTNANEGGASK